MTMPTSCIPRCLSVAMRAVMSHRMMRAALPVGRLCSVGASVHCMEQAQCHKWHSGQEVGAMYCTACILAVQAWAMKLILV